MDSQVGQDPGAEGKGSGLRSLRRGKESGLLPRKMAPNAVFRLWELSPTRFLSHPVFLPPNIPRMDWLSHVGLTPCPEMDRRTTEI